MKIKNNLSNHKKIQISQHFCNLLNFHSHNLWVSSLKNQKKQIKNLIEAKVKDQLLRDYPTSIKKWIVKQTITTSSRIF